MLRQFAYFGFCGAVFFASIGCGSGVKGTPSGGSAWSPQDRNSNLTPTTTGPSGPNGPAQARRIVARDARGQEYPTEELNVFARRNYFDKQRNEACRILPLSDSTAACLPVQLAAVSYTESTCTNPVYAYQPSSRDDVACFSQKAQWAAVRDYTGKDFKAAFGHVVALYGVGETVSGVSKAYFKRLNADGSTSCIEREGTYEYFALQPANLNDFARFNIEWTAGASNKLSQPMPKSADGQYFAGVFGTFAKDLTNQAGCELYPNSQTPKCEITDSTFLYDIYTSNTCGGTPQKGAYGNVNAAYVWGSDSELYRGTPGAQINAYQDDGNTCSAQGTFTTYTVGTKVELVSGVLERRGNGRIKANVVVADGLSFRNQFIDPITSETCTEAVDEQGKLRCLTAVESVYGFHYSDAACTQRVLALMQGDNETRPRMTGAHMCDDDKVFELGTELPGNTPIYELDSAGICSPVSASAFNGKKFRLGQEILRSTFPEFTP